MENVCYHALWWFIFPTSTFRVVPHHAEVFRQPHHKRKLFHAAKSSPMPTGELILNILRQEYE